MVTCLCALEASKYASNSGLLIFEISLVAIFIIVWPWDFAFNKRQPAKSLLPLLLAPQEQMYTPTNTRPEDYFTFVDL
jgi:hypothetical protein